MTNFAALEDDELLLLLRNGKEDAFKELYNRYWERLVAIGYYHTGDKQAAEDIVVEVLTGLWRKRSELEIRHLSAYLGTAVKYAVFKAMVRDKRRAILLQERGHGLLAEADETTEKKLEAKFLADFVKGVVEELPEKTRLVYRYSRDERLSTAEIADKMKLSPKSVEYHITQALKALREQLRKFNVLHL